MSITGSGFRRGENLPSPASQQAGRRCNPRGKATSVRRSGRWGRPSCSVGCSGWRSLQPDSPSRRRPEIRSTRPNTRSCSRRRLNRKKGPIKTRVKHWINSAELLYWLYTTCKEICANYMRTNLYTKLNNLIWTMPVCDIDTLLWTMAICYIRTIPVCDIRTMPICDIRTMPICDIRTMPICDNYTLTFLFYLITWIIYSLFGQIFTAQLTNGRCVSLSTDLVGGRTYPGSTRTRSSCWDRCRSSSFPAPRGSSATVGTVDWYDKMCITRASTT